MVELKENTAKQTCVWKTDKLATDIHIRKSNDGFIFFEFHFEKGLVPKELSGKYSSIPKAKQAITQYLCHVNIILLLICAIIFQPFFLQTHLCSS